MRLFLLETFFGNNNEEKWDQSFLIKTRTQNDTRKKNPIKKHKNKQKGRTDYNQVIIKWRILKIETKQSAHVPIKRALINNSNKLFACETSTSLNTHSAEITWHTK